MENALDNHMEQAGRAHGLRGPEDIPYWELDLDGPPPWPEDEAEYTEAQEFVALTLSEFVHWLRIIGGSDGLQTG